MNQVMLFANISSYNDEKTGSKAKGNISVSYPAHAAPVPGTLTDGTDLDANTMVLVAKLAPVTPIEADFEDMDDTTTVKNSALSPAVPPVADFEDADDVISPPLSISPETPAEADFTE